MGRLLALVLLSTLVVGIVAIGTEAQRRRPRAAATPATPATPPPSPAISEALGELQWGMSSAQVLDHFEKKIRDGHHDEIRKAPDAIREDRIRHKVDDEVRRLRASHVEFNGQVSGYETHFLGRGSEFTHHNSEAMLMYPDSNSENYYFFIQGKLWKWYKAFNAAVFEGRTFDQFAEALQGRFGPARERNEVVGGSSRPQRVLSWLAPDGRTRARAFEQRFYNFYCLILEDQETLGRLDELRTHRENAGGETHSVVDRVTGDDEGPSHASDDIVDRLTGKNRNPQQAPEKQP